MIWIFLLGIEEFTIRPTALERLGLFLEERLFPIFTERVTLIAFPHQDAAQVRVTCELNAHQIPGFALLKVNAWPNINQGWHFDRVFARHLDLELQARTAGGLIGVIDHFHFVFGEIIHAGERGQHIVAKLVTDHGRDLDEILFGDDPTFEASTGVCCDDARETRAQVIGGRPRRFSGGWRECDGHAIILPA